MESPIGRSPSLAADADKENDPFVSPTAQPQLRFSGFDSKMFALGPAASPLQAKRALEAHLAETERRMAEAGKLGTSLVQQQKELRDRLAEVEAQEAEGHLSGELRHKLAEIERDYNDVARQTARAFLPKQRVPSNEAAGGSPYVPEGKTGRRSVSPSKFEKFESHATGSPSKLSVPNRKLRNQPSNRIHDIEFAAEISTSLIAQVRNLQGLLAEKDEELRDVTNDKTRLEIDAESLQQRLKQLDESETRYKDENWTLEGQVQELIAAQKEAAEREKRSTQAFNVLQAEKNKTQKELDEVKASHAKLSEEHAAAVKHHDIEIGTAKRSIATADNERTALQRKIEDLTSQNQELARAFSSSQRAKMMERDSILNRSDEEFDNADDDITPEHSPPQSPMKGTTPRHSMLETETLKTSLQHAQRTIQSHRNQVHREKTEKLELRRMLQEARDEVERLRNESEAPVPRRSKKAEAKEQKKYSKLLLGSSRPTREDIYSEDDDEWEDHHEPPRLFGSESSGSPPPARDGPPTDFETANEATDGAFETANERATETEDFQTGAEEFSGTESDITETDTPTKAPRRTRSNLTATNFRKHTSRKSFDSTASTSNDEDAYEDAGVPGSAPPRMKLRVSRGGLHRRGRHGSNEQAAMEGSPASFVNSADGTPRTGGQSLFAELGELDGSGDESFNEGTPSRTLFGSNASNSSTLRTIPSIQKFGMVGSPAVADPSKAGSEATAVPRPEMIDSGTMTDSLEQPVHTALATEAPTTEAEDDASKRISTYSDSGAQFDPEISESLSKFPLPPLGEKPSLPELEFTSIESQHVTPVEVPEPAPPALTLSSIHKEELEPKAEPVVTPPVPELSVSGIKAEVLEPRAEPEPVPAPLSMSDIRAEALDPRAEPEPVPAPLSLSSISAQTLDPRAEPELPRPDLTVSQVHSQALEPDDTPLDTLAAVLGLSGSGGSHATEAAALAAGLGAGAIGAHLVERGVESDVAQPESTQSTAAIRSETVEPQVEQEAVPELSMTTINAQELEPIAEAQVVSELGMAAISSQSWEPVVEPEVVPDLGMAAIDSQSCEPVAEPEVVPQLSMAGISSQGYEPVAEEVILPELKMIDISSQELEPIAEPEPPAPEPIALGLSNVSSEHIHPVEETKPEAPLLTTSTIRAESVAPIKAPSPLDPRPDFGFTTIQSLETRPVSPRSPKRDAFILPRDAETPLTEPHKSRSGFVRGNVLGWDSHRSATPPLIAEDETRQSPGQSPQAETPESQRPLQAMSANSNVRTRKPRNVTLDSSAQTALTSDVLDQMMRPRQNQLALGDERTRSIESSLGASGPRMRRGSTESSGSVVRNKSRGIDSTMDFYRPTSATSSKAATEDLPPLPVNHRQAIEAARTQSSDGQGSMPPPLWPASSMRSSRPSTPSILKPTPSVGSPTPRAARASTATVMEDTPSIPNLRSRQSSVTSFASELDSRFNMPGATSAMVPGGFGPNTDPRMIQAITQTMIGEFLWKYTRKTGRDEMSENRHRRYFWVHPYTRTLYWSERDPTTAGQRSEARTKSIPIEAVRVVTDDNPMPPGLPRKSLIVVSPGRTVKFTCTTNQRHETWLNALSYLLLRTNQDGQSDAELMAENITREDIDEFNPQVGGRRPTRHRQHPSMSSFNSRSVRNESPVMDMSMNIPTLSPPKRRAPAQPRGKGTLTRLSGYWKPTHAFSTLRTRRAAVTPEVYVNGQVHDSAEDVRKEMERQDQEADRLENVRACCDGKHDVGTLTRGKGDRPRISHAHPHPSSTSGTPVSSVKSRS